MEIIKRNNKKYRKNILIYITAIVNIMLILFLISSYFGQVQSSEEIFTYKLKESTIKSSDEIYVVKNEENNKNEENKNEQNYQTGEAKYYIKVNCQTQTVTIYEKDEEGYYSVPTKVMLCSTGTYTPKTGTYKLTNYRKEWLSLQGDVYGQYCTQIVGNILFHSVPYLEKENPGSLEYWEYDKLGEEASLGCIRLTVQNAKWIFDNCEQGTRSRILLFRRSRTIRKTRG